MKKRSLAIISAALITAAVLALTAGLSLLNSSAIEVGESLSDVMTESAYDFAAEATPEADAEAEAEIEATPEADEGIGAAVSTRLPDIDTLDVVKVVTEEHGVEWEYVLWHDIVIDVYEHATGKLVGQVWLTDDEIYSEFCKVFDGDFDYTAELFDPHNPDDVPVYLPEAKYRVEFFWVERMTAHVSGCYGSLAFSYGLENNEIYEFTQTGYPLGNGETVIAFMESLVAEKIAQLENGICDELEADDSYATIIGLDGENSYWNGTTLSNGEFIEGVDRYTERFPYIAE